MAQSVIYTPGQLRDRVQLQSRTSTPAAVGGGVTEQYNTLENGEVSAKIEAVAGGFYVSAQEIGEFATHSIVVRYRQDYEQVKYIRWKKNGRRFRVRSVREADTQQRFHEFMCDEVRSGT